MTDTILAGYLIVALLMAYPTWRVTGQLGQPQLVRITLTLASPFVVIEALLRRTILGHW